MRRLLAVALAALALAVPAGGSTPFHASLKAFTHTPRVNAKWRYEVRVVDAAGRPLRATITVQLVDPFGGVHPVEFDCCKRNIVNHPIRGVFREAVEFPPESRGFRLTFRVLVRTAGRRALLTYWIRPR
jgi:hypothetical protein